jgi:hypothetical protein
MKPDREKWHNAYKYELIEMFDIANKIIRYRYLKADINDQKFHDFSRLIYKGSSGLISKYTTSSYKEEENLNE